MSEFTSTLIDPEIGAALIEAGPDGLGPLLLDVAQSLGGVEEVFAYIQMDGSQPRVIASSSGLGDVDTRVSLYTRRFYNFDPAGRARMATAVGSGFSRTIHVAEIDHAAYRSVCFERPRFTDKLCYGWRSDRRWLMVSFYRRRTGKALADLSLSSLANLALSAIAHIAPLEGLTNEALATRLRRRLARAYPRLTARELDVCSATLAGDSAELIAAQLGISRASVLTYRQRAYQRLEITSAHALLKGLPI